RWSWLALQRPTAPVPSPAVVDYIPCCWINPFSWFSYPFRGISATPPVMARTGSSRAALGPSPHVLQTELGTVGAVASRPRHFQASPQYDLLLQPRLEADVDRKEVPAHLRAPHRVPVTVQPVKPGHTLRRGVAQLPLVPQPHLRLPVAGLPAELLDQPQSEQCPLRAERRLPNLQAVLAVLGEPGLLHRHQAETQAGLHPQAARPRRPVRLHRDPVANRHEADVGFHRPRRGRIPGRGGRRVTVHLHVAAAGNLVPAVGGNPRELPRGVRWPVNRLAPLPAHARLPILSAYARLTALPASGRHAPASVHGHLGRLRRTP